MTKCFRSRPAAALGHSRRFAAVLLVTTAGSLLATSAGLSAPLPSNDASTALQRSITGSQQLDQETQNPKVEGNVVVTAPSAPSGLPRPGGPKVLVRTITFDPPSAFLTTAELDAITSRYVGKRLDFAGISQLVHDINDLYSKKGIVTASAVLPPQKLSDGNLKIDLVEGRLGKVSVVGDHQTQDGFLLHSITLDRHGVVDVPKAASDIEFFNKANQAQLRLLLQPGASFGLTDLTLGITEPKANTLQFFADNEGVQSTGEVEAGAYFRHYGWLGRDDSFTLYATDALGSVAGTVSYNVPITTFGTRLGASYTRSSIAVVDGPTKPLDVTGNSQAGTLSLSQQLLGTADWSVVALLSGSYGTSSSDSGATPLVDSITRKGVLGFSIAYSHGGTNISVQPQLIYANASDELADTARDIVLAAGTASGSVKLAKDDTLYATGAWQYTNSQLLPGDLLFQIGGANTVRGYQSDGVAGDSGYFAQVEYHHNLPDVGNGLDLFAFTDFGQVFSTFPAQTTLWSAGAGLNWTVAQGTTASLSAGVPLLQSLSGQPAATVYLSVRAQAF